MYIPKVKITIKPNGNMCGIIAFFGNESGVKVGEIWISFVHTFKTQNVSVIVVLIGMVFSVKEKPILGGHERFSIVSPESGSQPIVSEDGRQIVSVKR